MAYEFKISTTEEGLTLLQTLGVSTPRYDYSLFAGEIVLGDGSARGVGFPVAVWHWAFIQSAERAILRGLCPGKSAQVFIRTLKDDNTWANFEAIMIWPNSEERQAGRVIGFTLEFRNLVAV